MFKSSNCRCKEYTKALTKPSNPSIPVYVIFDGTPTPTSSTHPILVASSVIGSHFDTLVFQHRPRCQEKGKRWKRPETPAERSLSLHD